MTPDRVVETVVVDTSASVLALVVVVVVVVSDGPQRKAGGAKCNASWHDRTSRSRCSGTCI